MASNRLKLNPAKSEFLWCTTLRRHRLLDYSIFALGDTVRSPTSWRRPQPWCPLWQPMTIARFMWVNSFEADINCVGLKPSANSFRPQPPLSWSTASLSPGLTTGTGYLRVQTCQPNRGAVHKVRHARGGLEKVWQFETGEGSRACDVTLIQIFIIHMKHEI